MNLTYTNFKIYNKTLTTANTEYSQALTQNASYFEVKARTLVDIRFAMVSGDTADGGTYLTIPAGTSWSSRGRVFGTKTLYLRCMSSDGIVVEISEWS